MLAAVPASAQETWNGTVEVSESTVDIGPDSRGSYNVRLTQQPTRENEDGMPWGQEDLWWVLFHIDGARRADGKYKGIKLFPPIGRTFDNTNWSTWKDVRIEIDPDYDPAVSGPRATRVTITHEVSDDRGDCPVHGAGPLTVNIDYGVGSGSNNNGNSGNSGGNTEGNGGNSGGNNGNSGGNGGNSGNGQNGGNNGGSVGNVGKDTGNGGRSPDNGNQRPGEGGNSNQEAPRATPALSISDAAANEGGTLRFRVTLSPASNRPVSVDYAVVPGTAQEGADYVAPQPPLTLRFLPGQTRKTVQVETLEDDVDESNETLTVALSNASGASIGDGVGQGTIIGDAVRRIRLVDRVYLPEMARAAAFNAVKCRIDRALSHAAPGGLKQALNRLVPPAPPSFGWTGPHTGGMSVQQLLASLSFALKSNGRADGVGRVAAWSCGDYRRLADGARSGRVDWDGNVVNTQVGADVRVRPNLVAGLAVSRSSGAFRYRVGSAAAGIDGEHELRLNGLYPYMVWSPTPGTTLWGTVGHAWGDLDIRDRLGGRQRSRTATLGSAVFGANRQVLARGATTLTLKGEAGLAQFGVDDAGVGFGAADAALQRLKFAAEAARTHALSIGGSLTPWTELGLRLDGGDGDTGSGLELGGGLRYRHPALRWTVEGFGRRRVARGDSVPKEWGAGGTVRVDPDPTGAGFSASLTQSWGAPRNGADRLWEEDGRDRGEPAGQQIELQIGYGFSAPGDRGLLTPFAAMTLDGRSGRSFRWGGRLAFDPGATLNLEAERREVYGDYTAHRVMLRGTLRN